MRLRCCGANNRRCCASRDNGCRSVHCYPCMYTGCLSSTINRKPKKYIVAFVIIGKKPFLNSRLFLVAPKQSAFCFQFIPGIYALRVAAIFSLLTLKPRKKKNLSGATKICILHRVLEGVFSLGWLRNVP